jgi:hypothetical protein
MSPLEEILRNWFMLLHESVSYFDKEEYEKLHGLLEPAKAELAELKPRVFLTSERLPEYRADVFVWYPPSRMWVAGNLHKGHDRFGDYFNNYGFGAWYLIDGVTAWSPMLPEPNIPKVTK